MSEILGVLARGVATRRLNIVADSFNKIQSLRAICADIESVLDLPPEKLHRLIDLRAKSTSQTAQELFALSELDFKTGGFFVEFGATNGLTFSTTQLLEREFGWNGILAEPARCYHRELEANRSCHIEKACVWRDSNSVLMFNEMEWGVYSGISTHNFSYALPKEVKVGQRYEVNTISLHDMLEKYNAPKVVDYLSIDTEGSEYEILRNFDFNKYQFRVITCEHNFTPRRKKIFRLLTENGYARKYSGLSQTDDWYVKICP